MRVRLRHVPLLLPLAAALLVPVAWACSSDTSPAPAQTDAAPAPSDDAFVSTMPPAYECPDADLFDLPIADAALFPSAPDGPTTSGCYECATHACFQPIQVCYADCACRSAGAAYLACAFAPGASFDGCLGQVNAGDQSGTLKRIGTCVAESCAEACTRVAAPEGGGEDAADANDGANESGGANDGGDASDASRASDARDAG